MAGKIENKAKNVYCFDSLIRGFHVYKGIWTPVLDELLNTQIEEDNEHDKHAVAVIKNETIVGHVPWENAKVCKHFIKRGGIISLQVTGLQQNNGCGLEIPAKYTFTSVKKDTLLLPKLLK